MPQMMPLTWPIFLLFSITILHLIVSFLYFFTFKNIQLKLLHSHALNKQIWNWKW